jgi:hypothetical protein
MGRFGLRSRIGQTTAAGLLACGVGWVSAYSQDTRTVTEPVIPTGCTVLAAQQGIAGGEPTSETTFDTSRLQTALSATGVSCVELTASGTNNAFLIAPITVPAGVTLVVDGGVTLFGSRNPADYQVSTAGVETCGTVGTAGNGCNPLLSSTGSNSAIMGYGIIDGRGQDKLLVNGAAASYSWWDNAGTAQNNGGSQNNPILLQASGGSLTLYKITFRNSPMFHVKWSGNTTTRSGFTAWGVKVITPFTARNSDGIDPSGGNITVTNSSLSDGDDMVAVSASGAAANITVQNTNTYSGHGISVGSYTQGGLTNMLVQNITQMGTAADGNGGGLRIKTSQDRGGLVQNVTYQNICSANVKSPIYLSPYYNTNAGTSYPTFSNIVYRNIHVTTEGTITLTGYANTGATVIKPATVTFDNLILDTLKQTDFSPTPAYLTITEGPGPVSPLLLSQTGTGVTYNGGITNPTEAPYPCNPSTFQYLVGELYGTAAGATNLQSAAVTTNGAVTLNAMLQPAMSQVTYASNSGQGTYTGTAAPTAQVQFKEGTNVVGTASLAGNGTIASVTLNGLTAGRHTYTAYYAGDSTYTVPYSFGSVTVSVTQASATTTALTATPATMTYGTGTQLSAAVTSTASGTPTGQVVFVDNGANGAAQLTSTTLAGASAQTTQVLGAGSHSLQAVYSGDATFASSTSSAVPVTVTKASPAVALGVNGGAFAYGSGTTLTATVSPSGAGSYPTGTVIFYEGSTIVGSGSLNGAGMTSASLTPAGGSHTYTASYQGDANYAAAMSTGSSIAVTPASTTTTLAVSGSTAYGSTTTLTATITPGATGTLASPSGTVLFYDGTAVVGSGTVSATPGTATATALLGLGTHTLTAKYSGDGNFAGSASTSTLVTTVSPVSVAATPASLSLAAGGSGAASLSITPAGGYTGTVTLACASPVSYITCSVTPSSQTISSTSAVTATLNVQVAATVALNKPPAAWSARDGDREWLAMLLPLGVLALARKRKALRGVMMSCLALLALSVGLLGCSNSPASTTSNLPQAGVQAVTVTATAGIASSSTSVSVSVTN